MRFAKPFFVTDFHAIIFELCVKFSAKSESSRIKSYSIPLERHSLSLKNALFSKDKFDCAYDKIGLLTQLHRQ